MGLGGKTVLPKEIEDKLRDHILFIEEALFGLTHDDVRRLAYQPAVSNCHIFSDQKQMAGLDDFLISLQKVKKIK